jgi:flagellar hook-basal body complex protein FliE
MNPVTAATLARMPIEATTAGQASPISSNGFGKLVQQFIADTNAQQISADQSVERLATGQSDSIHETMLALTKADLSLQLFMQVRNKVIDAYQEVMRMSL